MSSTTSPVLVIIGGYPAAGKTTLARQLSKDLGIPAFSKDELKETLFDGLGTRDRQWSRRLGQASYDLLVLSLHKLMATGVSCIAESTFRPGDALLFEKLRQTYTARLIQVFCHAPVDELRERFHQRVANGTRHPGHRDEGNDDELIHLITSGELAPLEIDGPLIRIDTGAAQSDDFRSRYQSVLSHFAELSQFEDNRRGQ